MLTALICNKNKNFGIAAFQIYIMLLIVKIKEIACVFGVILLRHSDNFLPSKISLCEVNSNMLMRDWILAQNFSPRVRRDDESFDWVDDDD